MRITMHENRIEELTEHQQRESGRFTYPAGRREDSESLAYCKDRRILNELHAEAEALACNEEEQT